MLYKFRFDKFKWIAQEAEYHKKVGDFFVALYNTRPQYGKKIIATNGYLCTFDKEIYIYKSFPSDWIKM